MKKITRYYWLILLLLTLQLLYVNSHPPLAYAQTTPYSFEPAPCMFEGIDLGFYTIFPEDQGFECGYVTVPEQHSNPNGPTIQLPVAVRRATNIDPHPDPLFLAQGGPGGSAFEIFSLTLPNTAIAQERDIVIFNQRGTLFAKPELTCTELRDASPDLLALPPEEADPQWIKLLGDCYQRLKTEGVNLSAFNSVENAADVDAIRQALGYDTFNFYGVSYGTLLGLHLMRDYPDHVRSVILDSVVPPQINFISEVAQSENRVYDELFQFCANDPACAANYPNLEARFTAIVENLNKNPITLTITHPDTGESIDAYLNGNLLLDILYMSLYLSDNYAIFPKVVDSLENEDYIFIEQLWPFFVFDDTFSEGMYYAVICAEDADINIDQINTANLRPQIGNRVAYEIQSYLDSCAVWPVDVLPGSVDDPVASDIPTLLLSGQFDPITPPAFAAEAAKTLTTAYNIVDPLSSHGVAFNHDCANQIVQDFLNDPAQEPDSDCLNALDPAATVPPNAITLPLLAKAAALDGDFLMQTAFAGLLLLGVLSAFAVWLIAFVVRLIFSKKSAPTTPGQKLFRWGSRLLVLAFGLLAIVFVSGLVGFVGYVLFSETTAYLSAFTVPGSAQFILFIPYLLLLLAVGILVVTVFIWLQHNEKLWEKIYYSFLASCATGYVLILMYHDLLF